MKQQIYIYCLMFILLINIDLSAQEKDVKKTSDYSSSTLFNTDEPFKLTVYYNKKKLFRDVGDDRNYHPVLVRFDDAKNDSNWYKIKVKTRGNFRRNPDNCNLAPLLFQIPKKVRKDGNLFTGQDRLKLVVPCLRNKERFQEYLIQEYLVYKLYNLLTEASYRVRMTNVELIDSLKEDKPIIFTGFFIEETDQMASRLNGREIEIKHFHPGNVNKEQMTMLVVFQYLIGNTDWSVSAGHNIKLLFVDNQNVPLAVPYDFDWSGIVNAAYAKPSEKLDITSVRERVFRGYKRSMEEFEPVVKLFNQKKEEIYNLYKNCVWLTDKTKENTIEYLDEFYEIINDPKKLEREFIKKCRRAE